MLKRLRGKGIVKYWPPLAISAWPSLFQSKHQILWKAGLIDWCCLEKWSPKGQGLVPMALLGSGGTFKRSLGVCPWRRNWDKGSPPFSFPPSPWLPWDKHLHLPYDPLYTGHYHRPKAQGQATLGWNHESNKCFLLFTWFSHVFFQRDRKLTKPHAILEWGAHFLLMSYLFDPCRVRDRESRRLTLQYGWGKAHVPGSGSTHTCHPSQPRRAPWVSKAGAGKDVGPQLPHDNFSWGFWLHL